MIATSSRLRSFLIIFSMLLCIGLTMGGIAGFGVFVKPLVAYLNVGRAQVSGLVTAAMFSAAFSALIAGWLIDRFEIKWVVSSGLLIAATGYYLASGAEGYGLLVLSYILLGVGASLSGLVPLTVIVNNWFPERRAFAFSMGAMGLAVGPLIVNYVGTFSLLHADWRMAYLVLALTCLILVLPLALFFVSTHSRASGAQEERSRPGPANAPETPSAAVPGLSVGEALRGRSFWLLGLVYCTYAIIASAVAFHLVALVTDRGSTSADAAIAVTAMLVSSACGKPVFGALADRVGARRMLSVGLVSLALGIVGICVNAAMAFTVASAALFGFGAASVPVLVPALQTEVFGRRRLGTLASYVQMLQMVAGSAGGLLAGMSFDTYRSYLPIYIPLAALAAACALTPAALRSYAVR